MLRQILTIIICCSMLGSCAWLGFKKKASPEVTTAAETGQQTTTSDVAPRTPPLPVEGTEEKPKDAPEVISDPNVADEPAVTSSDGGSDGPSVIVCSVC